MSLHDPQLDPSELVNHVVDLLKHDGVPLYAQIHITEIIEDWEKLQVVLPDKYENWPPEDYPFYCSPEEVSNHISSTGLELNTIVYDLKSNDIILDNEGNKWKFFKFWSGENIKDSWVPKKGEYFISTVPKHVGEIFQMVGSVVACMTRHRFIIEKIE